MLLTKGKHLLKLGTKKALTVGKTLAIKDKDLYMSLVWWLSTRP